MLEDYANALSNQAPGRAVELLTERVNNGRRTQDHIASWVHSFARATETHATELEVLLAQHQLSEQELGTLAQSWQAVAGVVLEQARASTDLAKRLVAEVERPVRDAASRDQVDANAAIAELDRLPGGAAWEDQSGPIIARIQAADLSRLAGLRDTLTRMQTLQLDVFQSVTGSAQKAIEQLLAFDPADEVQSYVAQVVAGTAPVPREEPASRQGHGNSSNSRNSQRNVSRASKASLRDNASVISNSSESRRKGLRSRVGSIFGRRRNNKPAPAEPLSAPSPAVSRTESPVHTQRSSHQAPASPTRNATNSAPRTTQPPDFGLKPPGEELSNNARILPTGAPAPPPTRKHAESNQSSDPFGQVLQPETMYNGQARTTQGTQSQNHAVQAVAEEEDDIFTRPAQPNTDYSYRQNDVFRGANSLGGAAVGAAVGTAVGAGAAAAGAAARSRREVHSALFTDIPAARPEGSTADASREDPSEVFYTPAQQFQSRFEDGNRPAVPAAPQFGQPQQGQQAQQAQQAQQPVSQLQHRQRPSDPFATSSLNSSLPTHRESDEGLAAADTSVRSVDQGNYTPQNLSRTNTQRLSMMPLQKNITGDLVSNHPSLPTSNGLVATVVETLQTNLKDGHLENTSVTGEINLAVNGNEAVHSTIRVAGSQQLLSFVPNTVYASPSQVEANSFDVDSANFNGSGKSVTFAKYLSSLPSLVPILFVPKWRVEAHQSRLLLTYSLADSYPLDSAVLHNLIVAVPVSGGTASSAQSKPLATFSKEKQRVTWRFLQPVEIKKGEVKQLLCQFSTDGPAHEAQSGIEARFEIHGAPTAIRVDAYDGQNWTPVPTASTAFISRYGVTSGQQ